MFSILSITRNVSPLNNELFLEVNCLFGFSPYRVTAFSVSHYLLIAFYCHIRHLLLKSKAPAVILYLLVRNFGASEMSNSLERFNIMLSERVFCFYLRGIISSKVVLRCIREDYLVDRFFTVIGSHKNK